MCDTVIVTDDGKLSAHSIVLAAASPVLRAALKEADRPREHILVIPGVKTCVMKTVLRFIYAGEIVLIPEDMFAVLSVIEELELICLQQTKYVVAWWLNGRTPDS